MILSFIMQHEENNCQKLHFLMFTFEKNSLITLQRFFETAEVAIIGIFVLLKYENELLVTSDINLIQ